MSFILRAAFWLTVLAFLLPAAGYEVSPRSGGGVSNAAYVDGQRSAEAKQPDIDAGEMLTLAARSAQDMMGFCARNADVCERSHAVVAHVAHQTAFYGSKLFIWLTEKAREQAQEKSPDAAPAQAAIVEPARRPLHQAHLAGA